MKADNPVGCDQCGGFVDSQEFHGYTLHVCVSCGATIDSRMADYHKRIERGQAKHASLMAEGTAAWKRLRDRRALGGG